MRFRLSLILGIMLVAMALAACSGDDHYDYGNFKYAMTTYLGDDGSASSFTCYGHDDAPAVTLHGQHLGDTTLRSGDRVLLNYIEKGASGTSAQEVTVRGYSKVVTDALRMATTAQLAETPMDTIQLQSVWRTGSYINLRCKLRYTAAPRQLMLVVDQGTMAQSTVKCYLAHNTMGATSYYWAQAYMSFDVTAVWSRHTCKTLRVYLNDELYPATHYYDFIKN